MKRLHSLGLGLLAAGFFLSCVGLLAPRVADAQGVLIIVDRTELMPLPRPWPIPRPQPSPPVMSYKIKELAVQSKITDQVAQVQVSQSFVNTGSRQMEVSFVFPLPYDGAVDRLTFMVDSKEYEAKLLPAKEARTIYESYIRRNQDPALLEWMGTGMFKTSVFPVPPGAERKVTLKYSQLLRKDRQLTDFLFPLSTAKYTSTPVEKISFHATIESAAEIKSVYSPTHAIESSRPDSKHAVVKFEATNQVPVSDFRLFFDNAPGAMGASVISYRPDNNEDGYFLMLASPEIKAASAERPAKTVVFVVDRSGSMSGKKIEQAKDALKFVLNNLRTGDLFNIVAYDSVVESFKPELQKYDEETRKAALGYVESIFAGGSTNIDGALAKALGMLQDKSRPNFVIFLTDGLPTAGETNEGKIVVNAKTNNKIGARLLNMGVGYDLNSRLLDRLSAGNSGQSEFVRPDENIETHVSRLYAKIGSPVLSDVSVNFEFDAAAVEQGAPVNRIYPKEVRDVFEGEQVVVVGRYKKHGAAKVSVKGKVGSAESKFDFPASFTQSSGDQSYSFVEKLWAMRRIGEIIDELDLKGKNDELVNELVALSTKHGILTPYTSFLADENAPVRQLADRSFQLEQARASVLRLAEFDGKSGVAQRAEKKALKDAALPAGPGFGGGGFGPGGTPAAEGTINGKPVASTGRGAGGAYYRNIDTDKEVAADSVKTFANETLYKRGNQWIAASAQGIDPAKDADKIKTVERFSDDYFKLTTANTASENAVLAQQQSGEELIIKLRGQVYLIK